MNIIQAIKLYFATKKLTKEVSTMKSGWKTTEFWVTVFTGMSGIISQYGGLIPPPYGLIVTAVVAAGYTISRGLAKQNVPPQ